MKNKTEDQMKKFIDKLDKFATIFLWQLNGAWMLSMLYLFLFGQKYVDMPDGAGAGYLPLNGVLVPVENYPKEDLVSALLGWLVAMFLWVILAVVLDIVMFSVKKIVQRIKAAKAGTNENAL